MTRSINILLLAVNIVVFATVLLLPAGNGLLGLQIAVVNFIVQLAWVSYSKALKP
ncbi:hypothetical protein [Dongia sp.]|uniref:hypothetical protein n=1 Tax=Dongia sp. TaxID=1977262 RepID=UPI0035AF9D27